MAINQPLWLADPEVASQAVLLEAAGILGRRKPKAWDLISTRRCKIVGCRFVDEMQNSSNALKYGAIAGVGVLAWKAWESHRSAQAPATTQGEPVQELQGQARERRSLELLQAMIMAARADGHIDEVERAQLTGQIDVRVVLPPTGVFLPQGARPTGAGGGAALFPHVSIARPHSRALHPR